MNSQNRIIGIGSPHGADRAGWLVAERLSLRSGIDAAVCTLATPLEILDYLDGCESLVIIDACITGSEVGTVIRLRWPDRRILTQRNLSSHGFGVGEALQLAERLGRLPASVVLYGLEVANGEIEESGAEEPIPGIDELERRVLEEVTQWKLERPGLLRRNRDA